ncbi:MAG: hypothetical protein WDN04_14070 [Rhodospirillales bacterium]
MNATTLVVARGGLLGGDLVLGRGGFQFLQPQFHLVEQPHGAFGALAIKLMPQLGDLQLLMEAISAWSAAARARLAASSAFRRIDIVRQWFRISFHAPMESQMTPFDS